MFRTLRSRLLLSYALLIIVIVAVVTFVLIVILSVSQRTRLVPQFQALTVDYVAIARTLRDLPPEERDIRDPAAQERLTTTINESGGRLLVLTGNHEVVFDSRGRMNGQVVDYEQLPENLYAGLETGPGNGGPVEFVVFQEEDGRQWVGQLRQLPNRLAGRSLFLLNAVPQTTPAAAFAENFLRPILVAAAFAFLIAIVLAWLISRSVARPLQRMSAGARAIANGSYDTPIEPSGPREVRSLAESFNWMAAQVEATRTSQKDFVANVSHDLKTPLTSIQGWSQAILDGAAAEPEQLERAAAVIHNESARMDRMVNQLLLLANLESGRMQMNRVPLSLHDIAAEVRQALLFQAQEQDIALTIEGTDEPLAVLGDRDALVQLFINLVQNSLSHTPAGGQITLSLGRRPDGRPALTVIDNGRGIPREAQSRIFERFYQVDQARSGARRGTGLGLSIVQTIAEAHGAQIEVESVEGLGSRFGVSFGRDE